MKFEQTVQCMLDFDGDLFPTRKHCLNHLFCTIGNGFEWEGGELVSDEYDEVLKRWTLRADFTTAQEDSERVSFFLNSTLPNLEWLSKEKLHEEYKFWCEPSISMSYLLNYPDDIKADWLGGIRECIQCLKADGINVEPELEKQTDSEEQGMNLNL